ncbi:MAG: hypothetical protein EP344_08345 [Bacteroidetes bacterium]|nr:MAG: hypothetical protein EP344_08345 [Bacteroidota bacterium]
MQKLWLKNFEFHINPRTWNIAQDLVQAGAVRHLKEVERHFWVVQVTDADATFEVEVIISPHKIKAFTCECWEAGRRLMCPHIAATLFKLRQFLEQQQEIRQSRREAAQKESTGRLTTQNILSAISQDELNDFIRHYAQQDRDFALAMKTWFAGKMPHPDNPYIPVLISALPRHADVRALRDPEIRRLRKALDGLSTQLEQAAVDRNALTVYQICTAVLEKTTPLLPKLDEPKRMPLLRYCQSALDHLIQLPGDDLSPELRGNQRDFLFGLITAAYHPPDWDSQLISFLARNATEENFFSRIRELFDRTPFPASPVILHLFLAALAERKMPQAVVRVLEDYSERPVQIVAAIRFMAKLRYWESTILAGDHFLNHSGINAGQRMELETLILSAADQSNDLHTQRAYLRKRFCQYGNTDTYYQLKELAGQEWPSQRELLLQELRSGANHQTMATVLSLEKDAEGLIQLLQDHPDLDLLRAHEEVLLADHRDFVVDFYVKALSAYLEDHFGKQASDHIRKQLEGLVRKEQTELAKKIITNLVDRFPDRHSLNEDLDELFPKKRWNMALPAT